MDHTGCATHGGLDDFLIGVLLALDSQRRVQFNRAEPVVGIKTSVRSRNHLVAAQTTAPRTCQTDAASESRASLLAMPSGEEEKPEGLNPMHKQPVYAGCPAYLNGVSEAVFKVGMCLPAGPWVSDEDVRYIVDCIKEAVV